MKRSSLLIPAAAALAALIALPAAPAAGAPAPELTVTSLTVERVASPLGVDDPNPLLGWRVESPRAGTAQSAYEITVSTRSDLSGTVWDTGRVESSQSFDVRYQGAALAPQTRYFWHVRVWDDRGTASDWSEIAVFETAFFDDDAFGGEWIGSPHRSPGIPLTGANWIWYSGENPTGTVPPGDRYFRRSIDIPSAADVTSAQFQLTADDAFVLYVNGSEVLASPIEDEAWRIVRITDIAAYLHDGTNTLAIKASNAAGPFGVGGAAGLLGRLHVELAGGSTIDVRTDSDWLTWNTDQAGWETEGFDDSAWTAAVIGAAYGSGPWGNGAAAATPPEALLRRDFDVDRTVASARAYISGLGYYKLYLNGSRVGDHELDPGFTVYDKTTLYSTYDVTDALEHGGNTVGVSLGRGYFGQMQPDEWVSSVWHDDTKLKFELLITFTDGTTQRVVSDTSWAAADGPTTFESVWFGENYDARLEQAGWNDTGFDASGWQPAVRVSGPGGELRSQLFPAIRVTEDLEPVAVTQPAPGTFVYDFGRPTAGWAHVAFDGPSGAKVDMKYGEKLHADGTVDNDNVFFTIQNYAYTLKGDHDGFAPSYSYAGFRYLQVNVPDGVSVGDVTGMRVHTAVERTGDFASSSALLDAYDEAQADTILNNLHSIPTDTPMYEKRGYGADAFLTSDSAIALYDMQNFYDNWMRTHRDDQSPDGTFGNTVPGSVGSKTTTDPVWSSSYIEICWDLYQYYGDTRVLEENYDGLSLWMDHYAENIAATGDIYTGFSYGDWLSPAGASAPEGTRLLATAYLYRGATTMSEIADVLGRGADAARFDELATGIRNAFNAAFYDDAQGVYVDDPAAGYRQTSNLLPLSFGLVPDEHRATVLGNLVRDIEDRGDHLNTGAIGTKLLLPVLTENGYADLAYKVATNPSYPGWGYWFGALGATTMWEEWGESSRSHDHSFLGTVVDWLYQDVAGIQPTAPGYTGIRIHPYVFDGLESAEGHVDSPLGRIGSAWTRDDEAFTLDVTVPVGATAEVYVPIRDGDQVVVDPELPASSAPASRFAPTEIEAGFARFTVGSGSYRFVASAAVDPGDGGDGDGDGSGGGAGAGSGGGSGLASTGADPAIPMTIALVLLLLGAAATIRHRRARAQR